jgi:hypothetical protein
MIVSRPRRGYGHLLLGTLVLILAACTGGPGDGGPLVTRPPDVDPTEVPGSPVTSPTPGVATPTPGTATPTPAPTGTMNVKVYFFASDGLVAVSREVPRTSGVARAALGQLLAGPSPEGGLSSAIPNATLLLGISVTDRVATVDLSREFESGGGSASMFGRLAQVVYTVTQFPTVDSVTFRLDGQPVTVFSGEGIILDGPSTRADYTSYLPPIFIDGPAAGATLANPARITGLGNTFEAAFIIEIRDANDRILIRQPAMATCGTGCWGTIDLTIPYSVSSRQPGSVVVYDLSAKDGSVQNLRVTPVTLTP